VIEDSVVDYAYPTIRAEQALANLHNFMLSRKYDEAVQAGIDVMVETKLAINAIKLMKEKDHGLRQQTSPV